jgi:beta-N-acetylhexosaminidase
LRLGVDERRFFADANPWGFILFGRNVADPAQLSALTADLRDAVGRDAPILIDQEGGRVQRLRPPLARDWLPPLDFVARAGAGAERAMFLRYRLIAGELRGFGIDGNCAPQADLAGPQTHEFLKNRCYGSDPATVARLARACADGMLAGGVLPVLKHIPGHGRARLDSHLDLPHVTASLADLDASDFAPFRALNDLPMAMTAHVVYDAIAPDPATLSRPVIAMIRDRIGFGGLVMTDDISMRALSGDPAALTRASLDAGCDVVLLCNATLAVRAAVAGAAGLMTPQAQARAEAALACRRDPAPLDIAEAEADLAGLMRG